MMNTDSSIIILS